MSKRKLPATESSSTPSKRLRSAGQQGPGGSLDREGTAATRTTPQKAAKQAVGTAEEENDVSGSPTPRAVVTNGWATPKKGSVLDTPSRGGADRSAKRKSARLLVDAQAEHEWDGEDVLAQTILEDEEEGADEDSVRPEDAGATVGEDTSTPKQARRRSKATKTRQRSPTPEGAVAPEERFFFQNRGPSHISDNVFTSVKLLTHDEYFEEIRNEVERHKTEKAYLTKLHRRSFPQWKLELADGFNICLYGYGSKKALTHDFAEWLYQRSEPRPKIVVVNGYIPKMNIRSVLSIIASAVADESETLKLTGQPQEMLDTLLNILSSRDLNMPLVVLVNSIDAPSLRKSGYQNLLARLATHPSVQLVATADSPSFPLLWNSILLDQFSFIFHDCTTFEAYKSEQSVIDEFYDLLGRKGRRMGGKEGIKYVLKSLPPNAQNLYRILLGEILTILGDEAAEQAEEVEDDELPQQRQGRASAESTGIEYRLLYQKASEEFVASSDMNFRFLLKEFQDHQMITSRRDANGTELLCIPLGMEEMQAVLEDLVV